jgi:glutamate-5-semialdehyde dehydrogenase
MTINREGNNMSSEAAIKTLVENISRKAQAASRGLATLSGRTKNDILQDVADLLSTRKAAIQSENNKDVRAGEEKGLSAAMLDRLTISDKVIESMRTGLYEVIALPDPVGEIARLSRRPNDLMVGKMRVPLGVIGMIYESRPNVTIDAAALCLKAGNSIILRGGSEAINSNIILAEILQEALQKKDVNPDSVQVIPTTDRQAVNHLLKQEGCVDLIIPRGGESLIRFVSQNSQIPVLKHYKGVCHIYVDKDADLSMATPIIINSKVQRPGVCNALEGLLVHKEVADTYLPAITGELQRAGVFLLGCADTVAICPGVEPAEEQDWGSEFLDLKLCVKVVDSMDTAMDYIARYGSKHTETIVTENYTMANRFLAKVDASAVMVNASTRFNDGGELGLGAEIGISTTKLHAYGPMGLEELTTQKFVVYGTGQVRV